MGGGARALGAGAKTVYFSHALTPVRSMLLLSQSAVQCDTGTVFSYTLTPVCSMLLSSEKAVQCDNETVISYALTPLCSMLSVVAHRCTT